MPEPQYVYIKERQLKCHFCGHDRFKAVKTKIHQRVFTFLDLEFLSRNAVSYVCSNCGHIHEFVKP